MNSIRKLDFHVLLSEYLFLVSVKTQMQGNAIYKVPHGSSNVPLLRGVYGIHFPCESESKH